MRNLFPGYYRPTEEEFRVLWSEATFIFDTNVLLNLYSYPEDVRNVYLSVLRKLDQRIWIPYQVGLEFHRNRFSKIKQANQRVEKLLQTIQATSKQLSSEVTGIELEKRNIGVSNIQERLTAVQAAHDALSEAVQLACNKLPPISLEDPIGDQICALLENRVGKPPADQTALDAFVSDGQDRFDKGIPPGFADEVKGDETYRDRGITYPRKFGDLILWRQLLEHVKQNSLKAIVFVTGDRKKDWWWLDDGKTLGPLPSLVQEINSTTPAELFWMYSADQFLQNAEVHLKATEVTKEAIDQVKEVSDQYAEILRVSESITDGVHGSSLFADKQGALVQFFRDGRNQPIPTWSDQEFQDWLAQPKEPFDLFSGTPKRRQKGLLDYSIMPSSENAVLRWLQRARPDCVISAETEFPDFVAQGQGKISGYEIKQLRNFNPRSFPPSVIQALLRGYLEVSEGRLNDFSLVLVLPSEDITLFDDDDWRNELLNRTNKLIQKYPAGAVIYGAVDGGVFVPFVTLNY